MIVNWGREESDVNWEARALGSLIVRGLPVKSVTVNREYMHVDLYVAGNSPARTLIVPLRHTSSHPAHNFEATLQSAVRWYWINIPQADTFPPDPRPRVPAESSL